MQTTNRFIKRICTALLYLAWVGTGFAQTPFSGAHTHEVRTGEVTARLLAWAPQGIAAGKPLWLGLQLEHAPGWHTYWKNPGRAGAATTLQWKLPSGLDAGETVWPTPGKFAVEDIVNYGYENNTLFAIPVQVQSIPDQQTLTVELQANWLACKTECLPQSGRLHLQLPVGSPVTHNGSAFAALQRNSPQELPQAALQADINTNRKSITLSASGLPSSWHGKLLNAYPEQAGIVIPAITEDQSWQGDTWQVTFPLETHRTQNPDMFPLVLALQDTGNAPADAPASNAANTASYRLAAPTQGIWPTLHQLTETGTPPENTAEQDFETDNPTQTHPALMAGTSSIAQWLLGMGTAFLGGIILNLMPCVFPVLAIKVLGFVQHAHSVRELRWSGITYSLGCIISCVALAAALLALRAGGHLLGWGFQLQNPYAIAALAVLFTVLALNLLGVFTIGMWLPDAWQDTGKQQSSSTKAFFSGILAILVSSPCSAPFVGAALSLALQLPALQTLAVFACMGLGIALPVLLASFFPRMLQWLPKPGAWMEGLRQFMAFPMLATVVWLAWVLGRQSGITGMVVLLSMLILVAGLIWAWQHQGAVRRLGTIFFSLSLLGFGTLYGKQLSQPVLDIRTATHYTWENWTPERVQVAVRAGKPVFIDYTAAWCITCQFNKQTVLEQETFLQWAKQNQVVLLRADWTRHDPAITRALQDLNRVAVPTYAVYPPTTAHTPHVLEGVLSFEKISSILNTPQ